MPLGTKSKKAILSSLADEGMDSDPGRRHVLLSLEPNKPSRTREVSMGAVHLDFFHSALLATLEPSALSPAAARFPGFLFPMATGKDGESKDSDGIERQECLASLGGRKSRASRG